MTVSTTNSKHVYNGNGATRYWDFTFPIIDPADIEIYLTSPAGAVTEVTTNFAVDENNSRVEYPTVASGLALLAAGWKITLLRKVPLVQEVDLKNQGPLSAEVLESAYDRLTMQIQQHEEALSRAVKYAVDQTPTADDTDTFLTSIETSKNAAAASATAAAASATAAATSETNAGTSETNAAGSATAAAASATASAGSATAAATSATNSANSATAAATSETNAAGSATAAGTSATNAAASATAAGTSATNAANSETAAGTSATNAANSATAAATSETNAAASAAAAAAVSVKRYLGDLAFNGSDLSKDVDVSASSITDAREAIWGLSDNASDFERVLCSIKAINASTVRISSEIALAAGSYRLIGIQ